MFFFIKKTNNKTSLKERSFFIAGFLICLLAVLLNMISYKEENKITITRTNREFVNIRTKQVKVKKIVSQNTDAYFTNPTSRLTQSPTSKSKGRIITINYKKRQVIIRKDHNQEIFIPSGKKIIAKLSNSLDSRFNTSEVTALIPFAVKFKGAIVIPKNSILLGQFSHPKGSDRLFISFFKCIHPNGREFPIKAQALDSKDYQAGIIGTYHNKTGARIAKSIALGMISPMAQTLTEKEALGQGFIVTAKPKIKNALLQGLSKSSEIEAKRHIGELKGDQDYITVPSGKEIIVNLLERFKGEIAP